MANENESFFDKAKKALDDLTHLKIVTIVGEAKLTNGQIEFGNAKANVEAMVSTIGLLDGDVKTEITPKFITEYDQLREFHMLKERQGLDILQKNIEVVEKIGRVAAKFIEGSEFFKKEVDKQ